MPAIKGKPVLSRRKRVVLRCSICDTEYEQHQYRAKTSKYCSKECWLKRNPPKLETCIVCSSEFETYQRKQKYCGEECRNQDYTVRFTGEDSHLWRGGKTDSNKLLRTSSAFRLWRESVFARDAYKCVLCGEGGELHPHHIKHLSTHPEMAFDEGNGITLCPVCHSVIHGRRIGNADNAKLADPKYCDVIINRWQQYTGKEAVLESTGETFNSKIPV